MYISQKLKNIRVKNKTPQIRRREVRAMRHGAVTRSMTHGACAMCPWRGDLRHGLRHEEISATKNSTSLRQAHI